MRVVFGERPVVTLEFEEKSAKKGRFLVCIDGTPIAERHRLQGAVGGQFSAGLP